ncbi:MAG TPA: cupin domain-containing protein [Actinomycetota bacterium]|nr:cupin domain-containing protein [Actinomycetota bacterium]
MTEPTRSALERCVGRPDAFLGRFWGRHPIHHRTPDGFGDLLTFRDVDHMVAAMGLRVPAFRLVKDGETIPTSTYTKSGRIGSTPVTGIADPARIFQLFKDGATIVFQGMHRFWSPLAAFCRDLELELGHPTQVNGYITPPGSQGFALHEDAHDVFVLQAFGRKHWEVHEPAKSAEGDTGTGPTLAVELQPGDTLYIPMGAPHSARTQETVSGHLTVGILTYQWSDLVREVLKDIETDESFKERLPAGFHRNPAPFTSAVTAKLEELARRVEKVDARDAARTMVRKFLTSRPSRLTGSLEGLLALDRLTDHSVLRRRPQSVCHVEVDGGRLFAYLGDRELRMPATIEGAMRLVEERHEFRVQDFSPWLDAESRLVLARRLVREGVLEAAPPVDS